MLSKDLDIIRWIEGRFRVVAPDGRGVDVLATRVSEFVERPAAHRDPVSGPEPLSAATVIEPLPSIGRHLACGAASRVGTGTEPGATATG